MAALDSRVNPFRPDLAGEHLRERVSAARYASGVRRTVTRGSAALRHAARDDAPLDTELLRGQSVTVYEDAEGWSWLQNETDGYVGYALSRALGDQAEPPTHQLAVLRSYLFPAPDLKTPPLDLLSMTATMRVVGRAGGFSELDDGGWIYSAHLAPLGEYESDHAAVALRFLGAPYLWGGKTSTGLDCSGLIQLALGRCGQSVARDSDMQAASIGDAIEFSGDEAVLKRGDLVFWRGHAGIWIDPARFVHANATDMMVAVAPLAEIAARIESTSGEAVSAVRRP